MLSDAYGVDQGTMYSMISKGEVAGQDAVRIILDALSDSFAGAMEAQSKTFSGITSTIEGLQQELDNAMGEGYNQTRMQGLEAQKAWLAGDSGQEMQEAYSRCHERRHGQRRVQNRRSRRRCRRDGPNPDEGKNRRYERV